MKTTILSLFSLFFFACGSGGETNSGSETKTETAPTSANACESAGTKLCARACACATDGKCRIGVATDAGTASINFDDEQACLDLYVVLGCSGGGEPGFDYARCDGAIEATACVDTAGGKGVLMPAECNVNRK